MCGAGRLCIDDEFEVQLAVFLMFRRQRVGAFFGQLVVCMAELPL